MNLKEYKRQFDEDDAVGGDFIDAALEKIYADQEPEHFAPAVHFALGGEDPLTE